MLPVGPQSGKEVIMEGGPDTDRDWPWMSNHWPPDGSLFPFPEKEGKGVGSFLLQK